MSTVERNEGRIIVVGAGPAGLAAAYELVQRGLQPIVLEKADKVGGLARTETYQNYRFDIGGHRFFTKFAEIQHLWEQMLGPDLVLVPRLSSICYGGQFYRYPLELWETLAKLGLVESWRILASYLRTRWRPYSKEATFEQWMVNRFGHRLYQIFFQTYTEKVWGIPCQQIRADWAVQRIQDLSLRAVIANTLWNTNNAKTLIRQFHYPLLGSGMMWQRFREAVESRGGQVHLESEVVGLTRVGMRVSGVVVRSKGQTRRLGADQVISSMPLAELILQIEPLPPDEVVQAAMGLRHRDFILVNLIVGQASPFPDQWIYVHNPEVRAGRVQNFKNWSEALLPNPQKTCLGVEYFCTAGDDLWRRPDADLVALATRELAHLGLVDAAAVEKGLVIRQSHAYPLYDGDYNAHRETIRHFLAKMENLQTIGRNGLHRYNNMDHSMLTGLRAAANILGENHDLWDLNTEQVYYEHIA